MWVHIQAARVVARVTPGVWDARAGNVLEGDTVGSRETFLHAVAASGAGGGRDSERRFSGATRTFPEIS